MAGSASNASCRHKENKKMPKIRKVYIRCSCATIFYFRQHRLGPWIHKHNEEPFEKWKLHYGFCFLSREACEAHYRAREGHNFREQDRMSEQGKVEQEELLESEGREAAREHEGGKW